MRVLKVWCCAGTSCYPDPVYSRVHVTCRSAYLCVYVRVCVFFKFIYLFFSKRLTSRLGSEHRSVFKENCLHAKSAVDT